MSDESRKPDMDELESILKQIKALLDAAPPDLREKQLRFLKEVINER